MKIPFTSQLIAEIAPEIGATIFLEPEYGFVWEITFSNGKRHLWRRTNFNVNPLGSVEIVKDKWYTSLFLRRYGYKVADGKTFFSDELNKNLTITRDIHDGWKYIQSLGFPVIIKPNSLSQGAGVHKIENRDEYYVAAKSIFEQSSVMIIERFHIWQDYRVVVFDDEIISAYKRIPLSVQGDGKNAIKDLLSQKQEYFFQIGRDTIIDTEDARIQRRLAKQGLCFSSIPRNEQTIFLLDNANLSTGWESIDITKSIHLDFQQIAKQATKDMWLQLCGVDFMTKDITKPLSENQDYIILEMNGAPGLDNYMSNGEIQRENVKAMYKKILLKLSEQ